MLIFGGVQYNPLELVLPGAPGMDQHTKERIIAAYYALPDDLREPRASEAELQEFEAKYGTIPSDVRWFLAACGGCPIGAELLDDIHELARSHRKFHAEWGPPRGYTMANVFIIGWDGGGNPFGIEQATGRILVEYHDGGGIAEFAPSFEQWILDGLVRPFEQPPQSVPTMSRAAPIAKPANCTAVGRKHHWYNLDGQRSGCYHCNLVVPGQLWRHKT